MSYTEPNPVIGYVMSTLITKAEILRFVDLPEGTRSGNLFTYFSAKRPSTSLINSDLLPADKQNSSGSVQLYDYASRVPFSPSEYNALKRMPNAEERIADKIEEALRVQLETALDTVLATSTNTIALTTDNTFTRALFGQGLAQLSSYGVALEDVVFVTSSAAVAGTLSDAMYNTAGGTIGRQADLVNNYMWALGVPVYVDQNFSNSTGTNGTAAYMFGRGGVTGGLDDLDIMEMVKSSLTGGYDKTATLGYGFSLTEGVADGRVVKFINP